MSKKVVTVEGLTEKQVKAILTSHGCRVKVSTTEVKRDFEEIYDEIERRVDCGLLRIYCINQEADFGVLAVKEGSGIGVGKARCKPTDNYDYSRGRALATARACGFTDLEQELLEIM